MKKKKKEKTNNTDIKRFILVLTMTLCIIISMSTYWIYAYHHKYKEGKDNNYISYKIDNYVKTEGNNVYITNISEEINKDFQDKQKEILKNQIIDITTTKGIYKEILSIKISYIIKGDLSNYEEVLTKNIDLRTKKELTSDELLAKLNTTYKKIATDIFNEYIELKEDKKVTDAITGKELTSKEFNENSEKYIIRIREKLPEVIKIYLDKDKAYYQVRKNEINKVCYNTNTDINMGYITKEIGKI